MRTRPDDNDDAVEQAIARVLAAERDAQRSLSQARRHAEESLAAARSRARALSERAEHRILSARLAVEQRIAAHEARARADIEGLREHAEPDATELARLQLAVRRLAVELSSGSAR